MAMPFRLFAVLLLFCSALPTTVWGVRSGLFSSSSELSFTSILGDSELVRSFIDYAHSHGKHYRSQEEVRHRFQAYVRSLELIKTTNRRNLPYKLGVNQFADLTWEEFKGSYLSSTQQNCSATANQNGKHLRSMAIPGSKDWRTDRIVSAVKNQGSCGSCWTFRFYPFL